MTYQQLPSHTETKASSLIDMELARRRDGWFWTATDDKALIDFVRTNPVYDTGFWARAGNAAGGRNALSARRRWAALRAKGVPLPKIRRIWPRKWNDETVAKILSDVKVFGRSGVARDLDVSVDVIDGIIGRYRGFGATSGRRVRGVTLTNQEKADIALAEKAWAEFEKSQTKPALH